MNKIVRYFYLGLLINMFILNIQAQNNYTILRKISIPGNGGWDYISVDTVYNRLFVSHGNEVNVVDIKSGNNVHTITGMNGVHGIAFAYPVNKGYITCGRDTSVIVFDLKTLEVVKKIRSSGLNPDALLYDAFSNQVFVFNGRSSNATVIDVKTDYLTGTIELGGKPEAGVSDGKGNIYVNIEDRSKLLSINVKTNKVEKNWIIAPGVEPSGLAFDAKHGWLFSVCNNEKMVISDAREGKAIAAVPIGKNVDGAVFDPSTGIAFSSNGIGTITMVKEDKPGEFKALGNITTQKGARTIALDTRSHYLYLPVAEIDQTVKPEPGKRPTMKPGSFTVLEIGIR